MKTRKTIAAEAEQVMVDFARVYSPKGKKMDALIKQTQADLAAAKWLRNRSLKNSCGYGMN